MPFWLSAIVALCGIAYFDLFFEAAGILFIADFLYGVREAHTYYHVFILGSSTVLLIMIAHFIKQKSKFYK